MEGAAGLTVAAVAAMDAAVDGLVAVELDSLTDDELVAFTVSVERAVRRMPSVQDAVTAAVDARGLAHGRGCSSTVALLRQLLRLSSGEARARVQAADRFARRRAISGEPLEPLLPAVAAARAAGEISPKHAVDIAAALDALPAAVDEAGQVAGIEQTLVEHAKTFTPEELAKISHRLIATLNPDGTLAEVDYRERRRDITVHQRADGSVTGRFEGTAEFGELLLTTFNALAAPNPAEDGVQDLRSPGQRRHDGLLDALRLVMRARLLPSVNGVAATVVLAASETDWATNQGLARTGHGALLPVSEAKRIASGDARTLTVTLDRTAGIVGWTDTRRYFTETQRLAMAARDHGCSFPGCTSPPAWCQADHILEHTRGGPTEVSNGHLLCGHHHRNKNRYGWTLHMINSRPHWTPPAWLDPTQTPRRNHAHDPLGVGWDVGSSST